MMKNVIIVVVLVIVLYLLYLWLFTDTSTTQLFSVQNGKSYLELPAKDLPGGGLSGDYSYSFWMYVSNYNYRYGSDKAVLVRKGTEKGNYFPYVGLAGSTNDLEVKVSYKQGQTTTVHPCNVNDIPLQKWIHIVVTVVGRTVDIYLDGKLVKTCVLPGLPDLTDNDQAAIHINPLNPENNEMGVDGEKGFAGHLSKMEYYGRGLNPREVYERYRSGFSDTGAGGETLSKFNLKIAFLQDDKEVSGVTI